MAYNLRIRICAAALMTFALTTAKGQSANQTVAARIIHPPQPANISVNDEVILTCTAVAHHINWIINGVNAIEIHDPAFGYPQTIPSDNATVDVPIYTGKLRIRGTPSTNKTLNFVECSAVYLDENRLTIERSKPVLVKVQGLLDAVLDLDINSSTNTIQIGWKPPFTIKGVPIDHYEVDVCKSYTQLNSDMFYYSLQQPSSSAANYTISVRPVNMAGVGKEARIATTMKPPSSSTLNFYTQDLATTFNVSPTLSVQQNSYETQVEYIVPVAILFFVLIIAIPVLLILLIIVYTSRCKPMKHFKYIIKIETLKKENQSLKSEKQDLLDELKKTNEKLQSLLGTAV